MSVERRRFSAVAMRSVEVGIQRSADHLDPAEGRRGATSAAVSIAVVDACLVSTAAAAILLVAAATARRIREGVPASRGRMNGATSVCCSASAGLVV